jgi:cation:H+ antiporter
MFGIVLVVLFSNAIIRTTSVLLSRFEIPEFILGLLLFSLGTNLPEIIVAIRSWKRQIRDLAMSNLLGSAMGNVLLIGIFSLIKTTQVEVRLAYFTLMVFVAILFIMFWSFNKSEKRFSKKEGYALISLYTAFVVTQVLFQIVS